MHEHLEIIMPPTNRIEEDIKQILAPFDENGEGDEHNDRAFWDYWVIGGRWSGEKITAALPEKQTEAFYAELKAMKVTVSGIKFGKDELSPASQATAVDALWRKMFPDSPFYHCPFFKQAGSDKVESVRDHGEFWPDVMLLKDIPERLTASHLIIAGPRHKENGFEAVYMIQASAWNGVSHIDTKWDGKVRTAIDMHVSHIQSWSADYKKKITPAKNWLVVTVDYHH